MKILITTRARQDLREIGDFIAADNPLRARSFILELRDACMALAEQPLRFPQLEGFADGNYRRRVYGNYLIIYRAEESLVRVIRVVSASVNLTNTGLGV